MQLQSPTVFLVDDDPAALASLSALVSSMGLRVATFSNAEEYLEAFDPDAPGCLVTDVRMPGMSGIDLQERLRARGSELPVILITGKAETPVTVRAMKSGAVTLLEKPCGKQELFDSVRNAFEQDAEKRKHRAHQQEILDRVSRLTPQEFDVLTQIVDGKLNKVIAKEMDVSIRTIEARRHNIFEKMGTASLAELVKMVMEVRHLLQRPIS